MLEVRNLVKRYKISKKSKKQTVTALNKVSITFPDKGLVFLLGKSGSGKSTLLNAIGGLDTFDEGEIIIKGKSSKSFSQSDFDSYRNTFIGFIFQEYNVLEEFTVAKNLELAIELQGKKPTKENVNKLLQMVEMLDFAKRKPNQLSGGQKQRVAIARALIKNPEIIMADEPTGALDSNTGKQVMETLKNLSKEKLVIIVSHDREFAEIYGDRIIELKDGKIIRDVTKKEVEPDKEGSGLSVIDGDVIHIKKGHKFTQDDLNIICKKIMMSNSSSDTIISMSSEANVEVKKATAITDDGNREVFKDTLTEDVITKDYSHTKFKLIRSKLKFKDSFKMGASALKNKVGKLVFTILLSFVAFAMFGIVDTLSSFNRPVAVAESVQFSNKKHISLTEKTKGEYRDYYSAFSKEDLNVLKEKFPDIKIKPIANRDMPLGGSSSYDLNSIQVEIDGLGSLADNKAKKNFAYTGMIHVDESEITTYGLSLVAGRWPEKELEIAITNWQYKCIKQKYSEKVTKEDDVLNTYNKIRINNVDHYIVGIIENGADMSKYENESDDNNNQNMGMLQQMTAGTEFSFGIEHVVYVSENYYNNLLEKNDDIRISFSVENSNNGGTSKSLSEMHTDNMEVEFEKYKFPENAIKQFNTYIWHKDGIVLKDDHTFLKLKDNEVILPLYHLTNICGVQLSEKDIVDKINNGLVIKEVKREYNYETHDYDVSLSGVEYKVVGFVKNSGYAFASNEYFDENNSDEQLRFGGKYYVINDEDLSDAEEDHSITYFTTFNEYFNNYCSGRTNATIENFLQSSFGAIYMKDGYNFYENGEFYKLKEDEVIISQDAIPGSFRSEDAEDLSKLANSGTILELAINYGAPLTKLKVVGVVQSYDVFMVSEKVMNEKFLPLVEGFSYAVATLSDNSETNKAFIEYCERGDENGIKFIVQNDVTSILDEFQEIFNTLTEVFFYVGIVFAVFSAFLLMNFISTSISYKRREIGVLRALGARSKDVFGIFFNESSLIAMINFFLATITTIITCGILNNMVVQKLGLNLIILSVGVRQIGLMFGISMIAAFIASLLPVVKISRKKPIDAINNR